MFGKKKDDSGNGNGGNGGSKVLEMQKPDIFKQMKIGKGPGDDKFEVQYRLIFGTNPEHRCEWQAICYIFQQLKWAPPDPQYVVFLIAESGEPGKQAILLGFHTIQFMIHTEPMWVAPSARGAGVAEELTRRMVEYATGMCGITKFVANCKPGSFSSRLCESNGYTLMPGLSVYIFNHGNEPAPLPPAA